MTISIIIAVKTWQKNLEECVRACLKLDYPDFEIIILPDEPIKQGVLPAGSAPVKIIPTGPVGPAQKRDIALNYAKGEILGFLDDDAFPRKDWLRNAVIHFKDEQVASVGGPAVTPQNDTLSQKASGAVYSSFLVSSRFNYRYTPKNKQEVDDYPSCNLFVRKSVMKDIGGFNTNFWPGEDTKLCLDITKRLGKKIIYDPKVLVWHHRRPLFRMHFNQVKSYAFHRGYFVKKFPETSLKLAYFIPSIFLFFVLVGALLALLLPGLSPFYFSGLAFYLLVVFICSISKDLRLIPLVFFGIIITHAGYGFYFIKGLLSKGLPEENYNN
jgi:cellulose synthase/poly-beta-1,6-N-acetylglucosamine synthase-like glycosyltransferase